MKAFLPILPEMIFTILFVLYFIIGLLIRNRKINSIIVLTITFMTTLTIPRAHGKFFNGMFVADGFSQALKIIFMINLFLCVLISIRYEKIKDGLFFEYSLLMMLSTLAMMLIVSSRDLIPLLLSVEFMSLGLYLLTGFMTKDLKSNEASIKYYILGSFMSAIFLFGIAAIYGVTGSTEFSAIKEVLKNNEVLSIFHFSGMIAVITALSFKAGCAPFHQWSPDTYEGAPTTVTAFMSVGPKAAAVGAISILTYEAFSVRPELWIAPLVLIALLTMATGNILALRQNDIKRLLAYSSIAHAGYIMLAVISCSPDGMNSIVFYMTIYAFMNIGAFAVALSFPEGEKIEGYTGLSYLNKFVAIGMLVFMFSLTGIPPFGGFIAKFLVFKSIIHAGYVWVAIVGIIFSILSAYYYLRIVIKMFFSQTDKKLEYQIIPTSIKLVISISVLMITILGVFPEILNFGKFKLLYPVAFYKD